MTLLGKRGQEGVTVTTLVVIVVGIIVAVLLIVGASGGFKYVFEKFRIAPGQSLEAKTQACIIAAKNTLRADYCDEFQKVTISGEAQYANCEHPTVENNVQTEVTPLPCIGRTKDEAVKNQCATLIRGGKADAKTQVNARLCTSAVECARDLNGVASDKCNAGETIYRKGFKESLQGDVCCVR